MKAKELSFKNPLIDQNGMGQRDFQDWHDVLLKVINQLDIVIRKEAGDIASPSDPSLVINYTDDTIKIYMNGTYKSIYP